MLEPYFASRDHLPSGCAASSVFDELEFHFPHRGASSYPKEDLLAYRLEPEWLNEYLISLPPLPPCIEPVPD
jgi:hypothetical protein